MSESDNNGDPTAREAEPEYGPRSRPRRWRLWVVGLLLLILTGGLAAIGAIVVYYRIERMARPRIHDRPDNVPPHAVALVLGARVYRDGRLSAMLEDRVASAVDLYRARKVKKLLMSGDNSTRNYDEVTAMRDHAIRLGVPADDVVRDFAGFRTFDSVYRARDLWGVRSMVIVSQDFHLPRSIYIAQRLGVDAVGLSADRRQYLSIQRAEAREVLARAAAWLDLNLLGTKPRFLGPAETLSGEEQDRAWRAQTGRRAAGTN